MRVKGYCDGNPDAAASVMLAVAESTALASVVLAAVLL